jgi:hypothetical protein
MEKSQWNKEFLKVLINLIMGGFKVEVQKLLHDAA